MKVRSLILTLAGLLAAGPLSTAIAQQSHGPVHITSTAHAVSPPSTSSGADTSKKIYGPARVIPLLRPEDTGLATNGGGGEAGPAAPSVGNWSDADVQTTYSPSQLTVGNVFSGIGFTGKIPPDENLSVGVNTTGGSPQTQVVLTVNTSYTVYNTSGSGIKSGYLSSSFFGGLTNSLCSTVDGGDPIVLFDKLDGRWLISQLAYDSAFSDNHLCLAISRTSDATGAYDAYDFSFGSNLPDYPKLAVWPDGIYFSANIYKSNGSVLQFTGAQACSFPRSYLTNPPPSGNITFSCSPSNNAGIYNILPADLENLPGTAPLPSGPDYYMQYVDNVGPSSGNILRIYQFDPNAGSLNIVNNLTVNDFHDACGGGTCIPQEGTAQQLDSLGDRLMYRLSFRSYGDHDQMVANHSVQINSSDNQTGVRWYIIRRDQGGPFYVNKESTFSPDVSTYRWMGSIAQNKNGDLGLGYSLSGLTTYPGIAVTGLKNGSDTLMEQEQRMYHGTDQSYQGTYSRWGDYSSMSVDPTDDCSFWYTNEYVKPPVLSFDFLWNTVIGKVSFGNCSGSSFIITTGSLPGATVNTPYTATLTATGGNTPYTWSISAGRLPAGLSLNTSTGAITGTPTAIGTSNFTAKATDTTSQTATQNFSITVSGTLSITTTSLPNGTVSTAYSQALAATGGTGSYTWSISVGSLPAGLSLNTSSGAITGTPTTAGTSNFTAQVTDSGSPAQTATKALSITVNPPTLSISTTSLPSGTVGTAYSQALAATGGTGSYTWSISVGSLPAGLSLNTSSGAITGTPTTAGTSNFTAQVTDSGSPAQTATKALSITINPSPSADFALADNSSGTVTVPVGSSGTDTIIVTPSGGYSGTLSLSVSGLPRRTSSSFTVNPVSITNNNPGSSILTISTNRNTAPGSYGFAVTATDGTLSHTINLTLVVGTTSSPDFTISASPSSQTVSAGSSAPYTVSITGSGGFSDNVTLSASGLPAGATASFGPNPITGGTGSSTMTISTTTGTTPDGTYMLQITGTSPSVTHSTSVTLVVGTAAGGDFSLSASPTSVMLHGGGTAVYTISVTPVSGANPTVGFQVTGLPSGANAVFNPLSVTGSGSTTLSVMVPSGVVGTSTLTITGTNGQGLSHAVSVTLKLH